MLSMFVNIAGVLNDHGVKNKFLLVFFNTDLPLICYFCKTNLPRNMCLTISVKKMFISVKINLLYEIAVVPNINWN